MIQWLTLFHGWKEIDETRAKELATHIYYGAVAMTEDEKIAHINSRLKGISFTKEDLQKSFSKIKNNC